MEENNSSLGSLKLRCLFTMKAAFALSLSSQKSVYMKCDS